MASTCERDDKPSGSGGTELFIIIYTFSVPHLRGAGVALTS
jgi:hypothetical protein